MLNDAQNRKLIGKLKRALEVFEPYVFTKIAQLPYTMYETADRLETVPDATLAAVPETRPTGKTWGGEGRYCWFLTQYTPPNELAGQPLYAPTGIFGLLLTKSRSAPKTRMCWTLFLTCGSCCSWWRNCRKLLSAAQRF